MPYRKSIIKDVKQIDESPCQLYLIS